MELRVKNARIAFAHGLFKASAFEDGQVPKFGADFILQENSIVEKKVDGKWVPSTLKAAQGEACTDAFKGNKEKALAWFNDLEARQKAVRDGNKRKDKSGDIYDGYADAVYVTAKNKSRPAVFKADRTPCTEDDGVIYSGCFVNVTFDLYVNTDAKTKGIFAGLKGVQFFKDGDAFGGGGKASADDFEDATAGSNAEDFA